MLNLLNLKKMKTQINNLVSGNVNVAGTNYELRKSVASQIEKENGDMLTVLVAGSWYATLRRGQSQSGKTFWYQGQIPAHIYAKLGGLVNKKDKTEKYFLSISNSCKVEIYKLKSRKQNCNGYVNVEENKITIL